MKNPFVRFLVVVLVFIGLVSVFRWAGGLFGDSEKVLVSQNNILQMDLEGVIMNGKKFLKKLKKYREEDKIKAIVININSPGGAVGPSQEIYSEIKRVREEMKKPVICVSPGLLASGAYYAAVACDKVIVAPGALVGSIGVIMEFANLGKLYDWAKVDRYSITSGKFKDSGAEYRPMRPDEKALFQDLINDVYGQFKTAVKEGRKLSDDVLNQYADGRVMTGAQAVQLGFADSTGMLEDAIKAAAEAAKLGDDYDVYEVPKKKPSIWDWYQENEEDDLNSVDEAIKNFVVSKDQSMEKTIRHILLAESLNQPMLIMPGYW